MQVPISDHVIVMEKEFKSKQAHTGKITCMTKISDTEFMTSSEDMSFKIWDKDLQGCRYTIHAHEALHTMAITGEVGKPQYMISAHGEKDFMVKGLEMMN